MEAAEGGRSLVHKVDHQFSVESGYCLFIFGIMDKTNTFDFLVAPVTPFHSDGSIAYEVIEDYAAYLIENKAKGIFINGTTGEGLSLTQGERLSLAEKWRSCTVGKLRLMVNISDTAMARIRELGEHAQQIGADAISSVGPVYYNPSQISPLIDFCAQTAGSAPELPYYYYHIPSFSHVNFTAEEIMRAGMEQIPTLTGIKYTSPDLLDLTHVCELLENTMEIYYGVDEMLLGALNYPINGAIGSTYSLLLPVFRRIRSAYESGDMKTAHPQFTLAVASIEAMVHYSIIPALKAILTHRGLPMGPCRGPLPTLTKEETAHLLEKLEKVEGIKECVGI